MNEKTYKKGTHKKTGSCFQASLQFSETHNMGKL